MKLIINNRDRLGTLQDMVAWGLRAGHKIVIVDQASSFPPLLDWYEQGRYRDRRNDRVPYLIRRENLGPWPDIRSGLETLAHGDEFAAYTDSDLDLSKCPLDMLERFREILRANQQYRKVGCALRFDDVPDTEVGRHFKKREAEFWADELATNIYHAKIASTLAVYRVGQRCLKTADLYGPSLRVAGECTARHRPSYYTAENMPADERYYLEHLGRRGPVFSRILRQQIQHDAPASGFHEETQPLACASC